MSDSLITQESEWGVWVPNSATLSAGLSLAPFHVVLLVFEGEATWLVSLCVCVAVSQSSVLWVWQAWVETTALSEGMLVCVPRLSTSEGERSKLNERSNVVWQLDDCNSTSLGGGSTVSEGLSVWVEVVTTLRFFGMGTTTLTLVGIGTSTTDVEAGSLAPLNVTLGVLFPSGRVCPFRLACW